MALNKEQIAALYDAGIDVVEGKERPTHAAKRLERAFNINAGSAGICIYVLRHMLAGREYKRTLTEDIYRHFLSSFAERSDSSLENALFALEGHIAFLRTVRKSGCPLEVRLLDEFKNRVSPRAPVNYPDEIPPNSSGYAEGSTRTVIVNQYERNPEARRKCLEHHGYDCVVCGFNFVEKYGERGKDYIHVHHLRPLSQIGKAYIVDPINDLAPVCPNCHAMLHRGPELLDVGDLKNMLRDS
ncbi:HNH endonuclease [Pandoraea apista]|uniref:HNH endonuclease n=1 Tax=Pandoraea apista TaxID=93218 RepID=A0A5E5P256_9BURK|nr:HNH endonuclease [Pandoraea apista]AVF41516.1 hypothetical protein AL486_18795 [Pandoraea apista]OXS89566.1 hypothetical protein B7H01_19955 [Pandoraea apista]VVG70681.1 HNH endonuclease [Pandoraea apista]